MKVPEKVKAAESAALARLIQTRWPEGMSRAQFAKEYGIKGGDSMIGQHLSGNRPISMNAAIAYCRAFDVPLSALSPRLADLVARAGDTSDRTEFVGPGNVTGMRPGWPFPRVDERAVANLPLRTRKFLEAALFDAAEELGLSIRKRQSA